MAGSMSFVVGAAVLVVLIAVGVVVGINVGVVVAAAEVLHVHFERRCAAPCLFALLHCRCCAKAGCGSWTATTPGTRFTNLCTRQNMSGFAASTRQSARGTKRGSSKRSRNNRAASQARCSSSTTSSSSHWCRTECPPSSCFVGCATCPPWSQEARRPTVARSARTVSACCGSSRTSGRTPCARP